MFGKIRIQVHHLSRPAALVTWHPRLRRNPVELVQIRVYNIKLSANHAHTHTWPTNLWWEGENLALRNEFFCEYEETKKREKNEMKKKRTKNAKMKKEKIL